MQQPTTEEIKKKYEGFASSYDRWEGIGEFLIVGRARRALLWHARGRVLEVGVGTGKNFSYYPPDCQVIGVDYSPAMLRIARRRAYARGRNVTLHEMDAQNLRFKAGSFDTVIDTLGLCTYPDPVRVLREMKRVCKKGGRILLLEHGLSSNRFLRWLQQRVKQKQLEKLGCHVDREMIRLVKKAGLKIVSAERRFFGIVYVIRAKS